MFLCLRRLKIQGLTEKAPPLPLFQYTSTSSIIHLRLTCHPISGHKPQGWETLLQVICTYVRRINKYLLWRYVVGARSQVNTSIVVDTRQNEKYTCNEKRRCLLIKPACLGKHELFTLFTHPALWRHQTPNVPDGILRLFRILGPPERAKITIIKIVIYHVNIFLNFKYKNTNFETNE